MSHTDYKLALLISATLTYFVGVAFGLIAPGTTLSTIGKAIAIYTFFAIPIEIASHHNELKERAARLSLQLNITAFLAAFMWAFINVNSISKFFL